MCEALDAFIGRWMEPKLFWELFWYLFAGGCSTVVSFVGYSLCLRKLALGNVWSKALSWFAAATTAFVLMRLLAFSATESGFWASAAAFYATRIGTALLTLFLMWFILEKWLAWNLSDPERVRLEYGWWPEVLNGLVTILEIAINYFIAKFWIF